jgi:thioredoxin-like negative regulator of GroEL
MPERLAILVVVALGVGFTVVVVRRWNARRIRRLVGTPLWEDLGERPDGRSTVVTFSTPSCAACHQAQAPAVAAVERQLGSHAVRLIRVDAAERPEVARAFGVLTVPSTAVLAPQGHLVAVNQGFAPSNKLVEQLQRA